MAPGTQAVDPELLLAQAGWVRGLVRSLVLDCASAEEVVQDTWVAALEGSPGTGEPGRLRAWLAAVARNLARRRRRRDGLRAAVERAAARAERVEGGQAEVERMQLQRALVEAVLALDEPYRSAVILRHLDGLAAPEIARRQGCSPAAARQRVSRGLAELRVRLSSRFGEERAGMQALLPLLGGGWNGSLLAGGITMGSKLTLGVAGAAMAALALWLATAGGDRRDSGATRPAGESGGTRAADAGRGEPAHAGVAREPALEEGGAGGEGARVELERRAPAGSTEGLTLLRGRITDTRGRGLAGARIHVESPTESHELESDAEGRFVQELASIPEAEPVTLQVARESYLPRTLRLDPALPALVELQALPVLVGRVLDVERSALTPPGYVKADVLDAVTLEMRRSEVELGEGGSYRLEGLPLGRLVRVEARARGFAARSVPLDRVLAPDETAEIDVELERGAVITGTVLDARTRAPLTGASVWMEAFEPAEGSVHPTARAGEDGRFRLEGANVEVSIQDGERFVFFWLVAEAEGHAASPTRAYGARANEAHVYDFEMLLEPSECSLDIAARLEDGRPARGATVWAIDAQGNPTFANADEEGKYGFETVPAGPFALWLSFQETRSVSTSAGTSIELSLGLHALRADLELEAGQSRSEELVLRPPGSASLEGRVVDVEGRAVPGFAVRAQLNFQLGGLMLASGWDETRTDAEGRYRFGGLHPGKYQVWASGEGTALACAQPPHTYVDVAAGQGTEVDALAVGGCMTIEGTVERGEHDLAALALEVRDAATGAVRAATSPALDGLFRFEPLIARDYELVLVREGVVLDRTTVGPGSASAIFLRAR